MAELGVPLSAATIAEHYGELLDGFVLDATDAALRGQFSCALRVTDSVMVTLADRERLAREVLTFARELRPQAAARA
jgi:LPPG:FO 2-phospho-L-lactate transferase